jgi:hypothetical protein
MFRSVWSSPGGYVNVYRRYWIIWLTLLDLFVCVPPSQFFRFLWRPCLMKGKWAISSYRTSVVGETSGGEDCKSRPGLWGLVPTVRFLITSPERWTQSLRRVFPAVLPNFNPNGVNVRWVVVRLVRLGEILNQCCNIGESTLACSTKVRWASAHLHIGV